MTENFVGRQKELDAFKHCLTSPIQNGIYYFGPGGIGKTVLLKKITALCKEELNCQAVFIDFFSTKNRSIEGLQNTIVEQLNTPQAFQEIFETRKKLEEVRTGPAFSYQKELISSLQKQIEVTFSRCCNEAAKNKSIVIIFDSFEYVQWRDIGRWFIEDFLPSVKTDGEYGIIVVLAGRPEPKIASTPKNIIQYQLPGLSKDEGLPT